MEFENLLHHIITVYDSIIKIMYWAEVGKKIDECQKNIFHTYAATT